MTHKHPTHKIHIGQSLTAWEEKNRAKRHPIAETNTASKNKHATKLSPVNRSLQVVHHSHKGRRYIAQVPRQEKRITNLHDRTRLLELPREWQIHLLTSFEFPAIDTAPYCDGTHSVQRQTRTSRLDFWVGPQNQWSWLHCQRAEFESCWGVFNLLDWVRVICAPPPTLWRSNAERDVSVRITTANIRVKRSSDGEVLYDFPLFRVSYCGTDKGHKEVFSFVAKESDGRWELVCVSM